ncbi:hypothetical protein D3C85_1523100 [compost metagenome]
MLFCAEPLSSIFLILDLKTSDFKNNIKKSLFIKEVSIENIGMFSVTIQSLTSSDAIPIEPCNKSCLVKIKVLGYLFKSIINCLFRPISFPIL